MIAPESMTRCNTFFLFGIVLEEDADAVSWQAEAPGASTDTLAAAVIDALVAGDAITGSSRVALMQDMLCWMPTNNCARFSQ